MQRAQELEAVAALLRSESTFVLATSDENGCPRSAPLFYFVDDDLSLYWFSSASSDHSKNLARDPRAAASVYRPTERWQEICGVQMRGTVSRITERKQRKTITRAYVERFHLGTIFRVAIARSVLYEFRPTWLRYLDNSKHFGYKFEVTLGDAGQRDTELE